MYLKTNKNKTLNVSKLPYSKWWNNIKKFVSSKLNVHWASERRILAHFTVFNQKRWSQEFGNYMFTAIKLLAGKICTF